MGGRSKKRGSAEVEGAEVQVTTNALPMANVVRLMRRVIPSNVRISETAKQLTHDCSVDFVRFLRSQASERARSEHRRTLAPEDFTRSFQSLGLDHYVEPMQTYLQGYREHRQNTRGARSSGLPRPVPAPAPAPVPVPVPAPAPVPAVPALDDFDPLPPGEPITFTEEELEFLRSILPPPPDGY